MSDGITKAHIKAHLVESLKELKNFAGKAGDTNGVKYTLHIGKPFYEICEAFGLDAESIEKEMNGE